MINGGEKIMLAEERRMEIFKFLKRKSSATTEELITHFEVSGSTVRRDLEELSRKKLITRTHNGAVVNSPNVETGFLINYNSMLQEKKIVARKALSYINNGDFIALSGGSTCYMLASEICKSELVGLSIITNSINHVMLLLQADRDYEIILAGGIPRKGTYECIGEMPIQIIRKFNIDKYFLGVDGMSLEGGISFDNIGEADVSREIMQRSKQLFVVADHSKFSIIKHSKICELTDIDAIITDDSNDLFKERYQKYGVKIV